MLWMCGLGVWALLIVLHLIWGSSSEIRFGASDVFLGVGALLGIGDPLEGHLQAIFELRLWRALVAGGVGASLALAGALLQGLFRNGLASPGIIGASSGATLGVACAILVVSGYGPDLVLRSTSPFAPYLITVAAFIGAFGAVVLALVLSSSGGRVSVPTLLLVGVALNATFGGIFVALQSIRIDDWGVSKAMLSWTFGILEDRQAYHAAMVGVGLAVAAGCIPFVATELDLFAGGEADARRLGVHTARIQLVVIGAAALATSCSVAAAGAIGFVGLVVPHVARHWVGRGHRDLLPVSACGGAVLLLGLDLIQLKVTGRRALPPGVVMSLLGGPFFLYLLLKGRKGGEL
tara:strand:- start:6348 stop:7394 length:1047 start_codon:yes stop_codon:yes gene_type:complete